MAIISQTLQKENHFILQEAIIHERFDHQCRQLQPEVSADEPRDR
jgi:hypothetical protein